MSDLPDPPLGNMPDPDSAGMQPWEQRAAPGMGGGSEAEAPEDEPVPEPDAPRLLATDEPAELATIIDRQTGVATLQWPANHQPARGEREEQALNNAALWQLFDREDLYDTKRVTLEHFHLFEWFPLSPGIYHSPQAARARQAAYQELHHDDGHSYFHPRGKALMVRGGIGAVRLLPLQIGNEQYAFMTASSNGVCHQGFPVLVPRRFYGDIKERINRFGAAPVTLSGEMRYVLDQGAMRLLEQRRDLPRLYLHVDDLRFYDQPRDDVSRFLVSVVVSFFGEVDEVPGTYLTFASFDPRDDQALAQTCDWIEEFYVNGLHSGTVVTDFDAVRSRFPQAVFGLDTILRGELKQDRVQQLLAAAGIRDGGRAERVTTVVNNYIRVGNISNSSGIAIGHGAQARVDSRTGEG